MENCILGDFKALGIPNLLLKAYFNIMSTTKIIMPDKTVFRTRIPIRIGDINYGNHLGHVELVGILHEARMRFLASLGYKELNIEGSGLILHELHVQYKNQVYYGQLLDITLAVSEWSRCGFKVVYKVDILSLDTEIVEAANDNRQPQVAQNMATPRLAAMAQTSMLFFDYGLQKLASVPVCFKERVFMRQMSEKLGEI